MRYYLYLLAWATESILLAGWSIIKWTTHKIAVETGSLFHE